MLLLLLLLLLASGGVAVGFVDAPRVHAHLEPRRLDCAHHPRVKLRQQARKQRRAFARRHPARGKVSGQEETQRRQARGAACQAAPGATALLAVLEMVQLKKSVEYDKHIVLV
jgi:hypothetical protein